MKAITVSKKSELQLSCQTKMANRHYYDVATLFGWRKNSLGSEHEFHVDIISKMVPNLRYGA